MADAPKTTSDSHEERDSQAELAEAVIRQALSDAMSASISAKERERARQFLAGSEDLTYWCEVAGLPVDAVVAHARQVILGLPSPKLTSRWQPK